MHNANAGMTTQATKLTHVRALNTHALQYMRVGSFWVMTTTHVMAMAKQVRVVQPSVACQHYGVVSNADGELAPHFFWARANDVDFQPLGGLRHRRGAATGAPHFFFGLARTTWIFSTTGGPPSPP